MKLKSIARKLTTAVGVTAVAATIAIAPVQAASAAPVHTVAAASVPYSWWCYRGGYRDVHVWTPTSVGWWTAYMGYRCYGGYYSYV